MGPSVVSHGTPAALLARARDFLHTDEANNSLILGIVEGLPPHGSGPLMLTAERDHEADRGRVVAVALRTPPHKLLLTDAEPEAIDALRAHARAHLPDLPGIVGPSHAVERFADGWPGATRVLRMRLHELTEVADVPTPSGHVRIATPADAELLEPWAQSFIDHSGSDDPRPGAAVLAPYLAQGSLYLWVDGDEPRCMAGWSRGTAHGASITMVYTPPSFRGHGYATALVARLSAEILARGKRFCALFTNLANPTANAIYARIGYRPLCDHDSWSFPQP